MILTYQGDLADWPSWVVFFTKFKPDSTYLPSQSQDNILQLK